MGFANAVALVALSVIQDEAAAADVVRNTLRLGNEASFSISPLFPKLQPGEAIKLCGPADRLLILRVAVCA